MITPCINIARLFNWDLYGTKLKATKYKVTPCISGDRNTISEDRALSTFKSCVSFYADSKRM